MITRLLVGLVGIPLGLALIYYRERIVNTVGMMAWAEERFGAGSTYTVWVVGGLAVMIGSFLYMIGALPWLQ